MSSFFEELRAITGYDPEDDSPVDSLIAYKDLLEEEFGLAMDKLERRVVKARLEKDEDERRWANLGCAQDTEEAEESGRLIGFHEGLSWALHVVRGGEE